MLGGVEEEWRAPCLAVICCAACEAFGLSISAVPFALGTKCLRSTLLWLQVSSYYQCTKLGCAFWISMAAMNPGERVRLSLWAVFLPKILGVGNPYKTLKRVRKDRLGKQVFRISQDIPLPWCWGWRARRLRLGHLRIVKTRWFVVISCHLKRWIVFQGTLVFWSKWDSKHSPCNLVFYATFVLAWLIFLPSWIESKWNKVD